MEGLKVVLAVVIGGICGRRWPKNCGGPFSGPAHPEQRFRVSARGLAPVRPEVVNSVTRCPGNYLTRRGPKLGIPLSPTRLRCLRRRVIVRAPYASGRRAPPWMGRCTRPASRLDLARLQRTRSKVHLDTAGRASDNRGEHSGRPAFPPRTGRGAVGPGARTRLALASSRGETAVWAIRAGSPRRCVRATPGGDRRLRQHPRWSPAILPSARALVVRWGSKPPDPGLLKTRQHQAPRSAARSKARTFAAMSCPRPAADPLQSFGHGDPLLFGEAGGRGPLVPGDGRPDGGGKASGRRGEQRTRHPHRSQNRAARSFALPHRGAAKASRRLRPVERSALRAAWSTRILSVAAWNSRRVSGTSATPPPGPYRGRGTPEVDGAAERPALRSVSGSKSW
jgi:hypothetical protein